MKKSLKKPTIFKKYIGYSLTLLVVIAGLITTIFFESQKNSKENLSNQITWLDGDCPTGLDCSGPAHSKKRKDNEDGTYKLSLDVTGSALTETEPSKANVLIVYDVSGSMQYHYQEDYGSLGNYGGYVQLYRYVNGTCTAIKDTDNYTGTAYRTRNNNGTCSNQYTGQRYLQFRSYATEKVAHDFAAALLAKNTDNPDTVQMALVTFSGPTNSNDTTDEDDADVITTRVGTNNQVWTNSASFADHFSSTGTSVNLSYGGGTNWEAAMRKAYTTIQSARKNVPTFVVFITDGAPTFRLNRTLTRYSGSGVCQNANPGSGCTYYGHGSTTYDDMINYRSAIDEVKNIGNYNNSTTEETIKTTMFGIYAFGNEGDLLDDLIYAANNNGTDRTSQTGTISQQFDASKGTTATANYYNASNEAALAQAMNDIFTNIAKTLGVGDVSITDGTTANVSTSSGVSHLLEVDDNSFEYSLTMPVGEGNVITRKDLLTGEDYTIRLTANNDGTVTATSDRFVNGPVTVTGKIENNALTYEWTEATELYNFAPPAASFNSSTGSVDWNLESLGTLLNGVTYTVTFDVYPSQETYDLVANLKNGAIRYNAHYSETEYNALPANLKKYYTKVTNEETGEEYYELDANIRKYLSEDYTLETNTVASMKYSDTRPDENGNTVTGKTVYYNELPPAPLVSSKINVEKIWENSLDERSATDSEGNPLVLDMYLMRDNAKTEEKITVTRSTDPDHNWKDSKYISTGLLRAHGDETSGTLEVLDPGHDYTLEEPSVISYHWELTIEISHPMLINSNHVVTTLVEVAENDIPTDVKNDDENTYRKVDGKTYYKFGGKVYYAKSSGEEAELKAYNNRKSYVEFNKKVTGDAPEGKEFDFTFNIHNVIGTNETDSDVWFSVCDTKVDPTCKSDASIVVDITTNATPEYAKDDDGNVTDTKTGFYYAKRDTDITVKLQDGWNLRAINLGTGSTYTISENGVTTGTEMSDLNSSNPKYFRLDKIELDTSLAEGEDDGATIGETSISGSVVQPDTSYSITFTNDYPGTYVTVNKEWVGTKKNSVDVQLMQLIEGENEPTVAATATLNESNNWTYTFEGLPLRVKGTDKTITYSVEETAITGYSTNIENDKNDKHIWNITNTELTETTVVKQWDDANDQDGKRPTSLEMTLSNGTKVTLNEENHWTQTVRNLPKYRKVDGKDELIEYTWTEASVANYTARENDPVVSGTTSTFKNSHTPETFNINGEKRWDDNNDQDGKRPETLTFTLTGTIPAEEEGAEPVVVVTKTYDAVPPTEAEIAEGADANTWKYEFINLAKYNSGKEITYTVTEPKEIADYEFVSNVGGVFTNKHTPEKINIPVTKKWEDDSNHEGLRPTKITINLLVDGKVVRTTDLSGQNDEWSYTFENLDKYANGKEIAYTIEEVSVENYETVGPTGSIASGFTITNSREVEKTKVSVTKKWEDNNDQDGLRAKGLVATFHLYADGVDTGIVKTTGKDETVTFEDLDVYKDGKVIKYTIVEDAIDGYSTTPEVATSTGVEDGSTVTNSYTPEKTSVTIIKKWEDNNDQDGLRAKGTVATFHLYADGVDTKQTQTTAVDGRVTFTGLDKYKNGTLIVYTVKEDKITGYTTIPESMTVSDGQTITNTHTPEKTEVSVTKKWDDNNDQDGKRGNGATFHLYANGVDTKKTLTATDDETVTFEDLDKYANGEEIVYTIVEDAITGYETTPADALDSEKGVAPGSTVTNKHTPETFNINGEKRWDDNNNQDGKRPKELTFTLTGTIPAEEEGAEPTVVVNKTYKAVPPTEAEIEAGADANTWKYEFTDLPKYNSGKEITYTVTEPESIANYEFVSNVGGVFTNKHTPEKIDIPVTKKWEDESNHEGLRPTKITINLLVDGKVVRTTDLSGENDEWSYTFEDLDKYADGKEIAYTIEEVSVANYETVGPTGSIASGFTITNSREVEKTKVSVTKKWEDNNDQDGLRAKGLVATFHLYADGVDTGIVKTTGKDETVTFEDLDVYKDGKVIKYTIVEDAIDGYSTTPEVATSTGVEDGSTVTNSYTPEKTSVTIIKKWEDNNDQDGLRAKGTVATFHLYADGVDTKQTQTTAVDGRVTFTGLDKYKNGTLIVYTVKEDKITGYTTIPESMTVSDGQTITNTHTPEKTEVSVTKKWDDNNDQDGKRGNGATFHLYANGVDTKKTLTTTSDEKVTFEDLDKYADGEEIVYTIVEDAITGYETTPEVATTEGVESGSTVTNKHTPETFNINGEKRWVDNNNQDGKRPETLTFTLTGTIPAAEEGAEPTVVVNKTYKAVPPTEAEIEAGADANTWKYEFTDLPKYNSGKEITYTVTEPEEIADYEFVSNVGGVFTNKHDYETISVSITKEWKDNNDQDGLRAKGSVATFHLYADGVDTGKVKTTAKDETVTFDGLDKYKDGKEIKYTVVEDAIDGYETTPKAATTDGVSDGATVTNTHTPEKVDVSVTKVWEDNNNEEGFRPGSITIKLLANGDVKATKELSGNGNTWSHTFKDLDKYVDGVEVTYTIEEVSVENYETVGPTGSVADGFTITNRREVEKVEIVGKKIWVDENDQDGIRPNGITVYLLADGTKVQELPVEGNSDTLEFKFENLNKYKDGKEIVYTIAEKAVDGYTGVVSGNTITNTHTPVTIEVSGSKQWVDDNNRDGLRTKSVKVNLKADGEVYDTKDVEAGDDGKWSYKFTDLPKYKDHGTEITYTVEEAEVPEGYTVSYEGTNNTTIVNTHSPAKKTISGTKTWDDDDDRDGLRPDNITIYLKGYIEKDKYIVEKEVTISEEDKDENGNWAYSFDNLFEYSEGKVIVYEISESEVGGYSLKLENYDLTNTHVPEKIEISGTKTWDDGEDQDGIRPKSITVNVLDGEEVVDTAEVTPDEEGNWTYKFTGLPKYKDHGTEIEYTVEEANVAEGYTREITDYDIENIHTPETVTLIINKDWNDEDNNDGIRPESIKVDLYKVIEDEETFVKNYTISAKNDWTLKILELPKYQKGKLITYKLVEEAVNGYVSSQEDQIIEVDNNITQVIVNKHIPEKISIKGTKTWVDDDNAKGKRPEYIKVKIFADGVLIDTITVSATDNWEYAVENLYKFKKGQEITYTIEEEEVEKYTTNYDKYNIINIYDGTGDVIPPDTKVDVDIIRNLKEFNNIFLMLASSVAIAGRKRLLEIK